MPEQNHGECKLDHCKEVFRMILMAGPYSFLRSVAYVRYLPGKVKTLGIEVEPPQQACAGRATQPSDTDPKTAVKGGSQQKRAATAGQGLTAAVAAT